MSVTNVVNPKGRTSTARHIEANQLKVVTNCPSALNIQTYEGNVRTFDASGFRLRSERSQTFECS